MLLVLTYSSSANLEPSLPVPLSFIPPNAARKHSRAQLCSPPFRLPVPHSPSTSETCSRGRSRPRVRHSRPLQSVSPLRNQMASAARQDQILIFEEQHLCRGIYQYGGSVEIGSQLLVDLSEEDFRHERVYQHRKLSL